MSAQCDADASAAASPPKRLRKRYRRDVRTLADLDGRTAPARRARSLAARLCAELPGDPTAGQQELVTRCALLSILASDAEVKILRNEAIDVHGYVALVNCQRRVLQALGLQCDPKIIDGTDGTQSSLDTLYGHVWPKYRRGEAERELLAALKDDDDNAPPAEEDQKS